MSFLKITNLNLKQKITINVIIFLLVAGGIINFLILPTVYDIKNIKDQIDAQRIDLEIKYQKGQSLKKLLENLKKIEPQLAKLDQIFIKEEDALGFITTLENIAEQNNVEQKINLLTNSEQKNNIYKKIPIQLLTADSFLGQMDYLISLESLNYYINIKSIELTLLGVGQAPVSGDSETAPKSRLKMLISADSFWK